MATSAPPSKQPGDGDRAGQLAALFLVVGAAAVAAIPLLFLNRAAGAEERPRRQDAPSPAELYSKVSPALVTITISNDHLQPIGTWWGFFVDHQELSLKQRRPGTNVTWEKYEASMARAFSRLHEARYQVGHVLTSRQAIRGAVEAKVALSSGIVGRIAEIRCENEDADLALLFVTMPSDDGPATLRLAHSMPTVGTAAFAIATPGGPEGALTNGIIRGDHPYDGARWLQTAVPLGSGSSGGPVLLPDGRVAGIASAIEPGQRRLNFAASADVVRRFLEGPYKQRELWEGMSYLKEELSAYSKLARPTDGKTDEPSPEQVLWAALRRNDLRGQPRQAIQAAEEALKGGMAAGFQYLAHFLIGRARLDMAADKFFQVRDAPPGEDPLALRRRVFREAPESQSALESLKQASQLNPRFSPVYERLYEAYRLGGQDAEALEAANMLVQLVPECSEAYSMRADSHRGLGRFESALHDYRTAAELNPKNGLVYHGMGETYRELEMFEEAVAAYRTAIQLGGDSYPVYVELGLSLRRLNRFAEAVAAFQAGRDKAPDAARREMFDRFISECRAEECGREHVPGPERATRGVP